MGTRKLKEEGMCTSISPKTILALTHHLMRGTDEKRTNQGEDLNLSASQYPEILLEIVH